jgi:predicted nuclease of predicted toxin-antitoxin system
VKLKLDENLSRHLKPLLSALQHDATTAADEGLLSKPDIAVAAAAKAEGRILLTLDLEFGDLRKFPPGSHPGIILFRPRSLGPLTVNRFVEAFMRDTDLKELAGCVVVVEPTRVRIRRPPLDTESEEWKEIPL